MWFIWFMLVVYILLTAYTLWRSIHYIRRLSTKHDYKLICIIYGLLFIGCCSTILLVGLLPYGAARIAIHKFSNYWLGFYVYIVFFTLVADVLSLIVKLAYRGSSKYKKDISVIARFTSIAVFALSISFTAYGLIHADNIFTNLYDLEVDKEAGSIDELDIVLIADLHLGYSIDADMMTQMVERVNDCNPDIILVAGDIIDNEYEAMSDPDHIASILSSMKSKYGTYAVYGNHDVAETLIGGFSITPAEQALRDPRVEAFMSKAGFTMLEDDSVLIDDKFYIVGRLDGEKAGDGTNNRLETKELLAGLDKSRPVFLLSHEPDELAENAAAGVDMQLSGHTHAGQFFPLTVTSPLVWDNSWGYLKVGNMHSLVTSGVGVYGPDMRVMTDSEIMHITVHFTR